MDPVRALRRATRWFWALTLTAVLLVGALSTQIGARPSPTTGLAVAGTGVLLAVVVAQACRLMLAIGRAAIARPVEINFIESSDKPPGYRHARGEG